MIKMPIKGGSHGFMEKSQGMKLKNNTGASQLQHIIYPPSMSLQLSRGSYTKASNTAITLSLFSRRTLITLLQVSLKLPSIPVTYSQGCSNTLKNNKKKTTTKQNKQTNRTKMWDPQFVLLCDIPKLRGDYIIIIVAGKTFPKYTKPRKYYLTEFIHYTVYIIIYIWRASSPPWHWSAFW